jgi:hypothetical protein
LRLLSTHNLQVLRKVTGTGYIDQETRLWVSGTYDETINLTCGLQPLSGKNRKLLPEGVSATDSKLVFSREALRTAEEHLEQESDVVIVAGINYEVISVEDWTGYGLKSDHYKSIITRKDRLGG